MGLGRLLRLLAVLGLVQLTVGVATAIAVPPDPSQNYSPGRLPYGCQGTATSAKCINAAVYYLDQARAKVVGHAAPYALPANFAQLKADQQAFILTNLERVYYHLRPIAGLTAALDQDAFSSGVYTDSDPVSSDANFDEFGSNWAGSFPNMPLAYEAWVYDDGYGSGNIDCTAPDSPACWGHRHNVLGPLLGTRASAMGAAAGKDSHGAVGYAMLLGTGNASYSPSYSYTWAQARKAGAGSHSYPVSKPASVALSVQISVTGNNLILRIGPPSGTHLECSLVKTQAGHIPAPSFKPCSTPVTYHNISLASYRFIVTSSIGWASQDLTIY
jgi:hypothetical protein